ncbi:hypothetical protein A4X13_0g3471 [Tilletia indica]|uniref:Peptidase S8/S53 domain-containing protein n=1 Tax=Tilletia indica TaxID=43049 RepID=A0A8T8T362_9BASI|nr:hypothetical protein A4X13_0g3471 [Tilletia indica]
MVKASWAALRLLAILPVFLNCATVTVASLKSKSHTGLNAQKDSTAQKHVPGGYVVLFKNDAASQPLKASDRTESVDDTVHTAFEQFLSQKNVPYTTRIKFKSTNMVSAMSLQLHNEEDLSALHSFDGTADVFKIGVASIDSLKPVRAPMHHRSVADKHHQPHSAKSNRAGTTAQDTFTPHVMTGIDKVHADGNFGQGIVIGLLDSGVDYTHHALNGGQEDGKPCFGPSCPISGGMSFYDANSNLSITSDPFPYCNGEGDWGHGTHTAGTIIADDKVRGFTGGSPGAKLKAYRICGCGEEDGPEDVIAAGLQRAFYDGVDVISMSLSVPSGWREGFLNVVSKRITDAGLPMVTSAGNVGDAGTFYAKAPAGGDGVHAVGSVGNLRVPGFTATVNTKSSSFTFVYAGGIPISLNGSQSLPVILSEFAGLNESCAIMDNSTSLAGSLPVIAIRDCYPGDEASYLTAANASIALWYQDTTSPLLATDVDLEIPGFQGLITDEKSGRRIVEAVKAEGKVTIDFSNPQASYIEDDVGGGFMAPYTNYGPDWELNSYVGSSSVGSNVLSTWPLSQGGYAVLSGTSMSTPLTASAYALYMSAKGKKETLAQLRSVFAATATPLHYSSTIKVIDTVGRQGGGLWNVARAIASTSRVWPDRLSLNDTEFFNGTQKLTITNIGAGPQKMHVGHMPAGTVYTRSAGKWSYHDGLVPQNKDQATVTVTPSHFTVAPGQSKTVTVTFQAPAPNQDTMPMFSGYITFKSHHDSGNLNVPYLGVAAKMRELPIILKNPKFNVPAIVDPTSQGPVDDSATYNLQTADQQPIFQYGFKAGTALATIDLVYANSTTATSFRRDAAQPSNSSSSAADIPAGAIVGNLGTAMWNPRSYDTPGTVTITEKMYDDRNVSKTIEDGEYRVLLRALKLRGDPNDPKDFESFISEKFVVKRN